MGRGVGGGCVVCAVPGEEIAVVGEGVAGGCSADIETEDSEGVAVIGGGVEEMRVESCVGAVVGGVLEGILLVVADGVGDGVIIDGHCVDTQGDGAILAMGGGEENGVGAAVGDGETVPGDREYIVAHGAVEDGQFVVPDDVKIVGDDGVAVVNVGDMDVIVLHAVGEGCAIKCIGQLGLVDFLANGGGGIGIDSEVEGDKAVALVVGG